MGTPVINFSREYIRDLPQYCSPAISSLIYDLKIDVYKDYTATILYLYTKKYINLVKYENTYKISVKQQDFSNLGRCEKYVLETIKNKEHLDENRLKEEIIKEAQEKGLLTNKNYSKKIKILLLLIIIFSSLFISYYLSKIVFLILFFIFGTLAIRIFYIINSENEILSTIKFVDTDYVRTEDGKKIALLLKGLKKYINEYTLLKEKEIEHVQILENYIPYALALDEADTVEEFIKNNEEYRNLIYNRKNKIL